MRLDRTVVTEPVLSDSAAIELLRGLIAIPSLSGDEHAAVAYLVEAMAELGMDAYIDPTGNAVGSVGVGSPEIVLLGHIDTVPGQIPVQIADGKLYGRGAVDAKGPLAAFVAAAARLGTQPASRGRVTVIGCVEEEAPSSRGAHGVLDRYHPDVCIVGEPSGVDTITIGYKGSVRMRVRFVQPGGHSAHARVTAAERGSDLWQQIRSWATSVNMGRERAWDQLLPALVGINSGGDGLNEWAVLELSIRLPEDIDPAAVEAYLCKLAPEAEFEILGAVPAFRSSRATPPARALLAALRSQGVAARFVVKTGTSDMNLVGPAWGCPILTYGPGDASLDHTPGEHIVLADYLQSIEVLQHALGVLMQNSVPVTPLRQ